MSNSPKVFSRIFRLRLGYIAFHPFERQLRARGFYQGNKNSLTNEKLLEEVTSKASDNAGVFCP
jgi:hypothetical protein